MLYPLSIWVAVGISLTVMGTPRLGSAGLPLAYFLSLSVIHVPGALVAYFDELSDPADWTQIGFEQTVIGMVAFAFAVLVARRTAAFPRRAAHAEVGRNLDPRTLAALDRLALVYVSIGLFGGSLLGVLLGDIPSTIAIVTRLGSLVVVGACLRLWIARQNKNPCKLWSTIAVLPLVPVHTTITESFIGGSTIYIVLPIVCFLCAQSKRRLARLILAPAVLFVGLSVFVNYQAAKGDLRRMTWYEHSSIGNRVQRVAGIFQTWEWLDLSSDRHRSLINERLNQNWLVGAAVERLELKQVDYTLGATLGNMIMSLIPSAIWPDKPPVGGSGAIVHDLTGIEFAEGTSVGAGQVLEFYASSGTLGVIGGFLIHGWLLGRIDLRVVRCLDRGDQKGFVFWFLIGLPLLLADGSLLEIVVGAAAAAVVGYGIGHLLGRGFDPIQTRQKSLTRGSRQLAR
jgi:hypothetical protein